MAQPPDDPRPVRPLQATPVHHSWILQHPSFSNSPLIDAPSNASPPRPAAICPDGDSLPLGQNVTPGVSYDPHPPHHPNTREPHAPAMPPPSHYSTFFRNSMPQPSSSIPGQAGPLNVSPPAANPSLRPPLWHMQESPPYRNIIPRPPISRPIKAKQPQYLGKGQIGSKGSSALHEAQFRQTYDVTQNFQPGTGSDDLILYERYQGQKSPEAVVQPWVESEASTVLERSQTQALAEAISGQSRIASEAPNPEKDSPSRAIAEINKLMEDEGLGDISSSDEDFREFKAGLTKAKYDAEIFKASRDQEDPTGRKGTWRFSGRSKNDIVARGGYRGTRGPRLAAEPRGDIKARLAQASEAFLLANYDEAKAIATEIIRINAETHQAWTVLASCFYELGNRDRALTALTYAAHLEPKNIDGWIHCASVFLEETGTGKRRDKALQSAFFCYSAALKVDPKERRARLGKASIYIERNAPAGAVSEFKKIHVLEPHDLDIIVNLCAAYYDNKEFANARDLYKETFARLRANDEILTDTLGWSDVNSYIAIYEQLGEQEAAIKELKSLSRWLLGRDSESFWDTITQDDREWDLDMLRRVEIPDFEVNSFSLDRYGQSLPLELRTKLGICRLELGHHEEAMRHFDCLRDLGESGEEKVLVYYDIYRQIADKLQNAELYQDALSFFQLLKQVPEENTGDLYVQMGFCYLKDNLHGKAEECFHTAIEVDRDNTEARVQLAKLYESLNEQEQAFVYINEVLAIKRIQNPEPVKARRRRQGQSLVEKPTAQSEMPFESEDEDLNPVKYFTYKRRRLADPGKKLDEEINRADEVQTQYLVFQAELEEMRAGNCEATRIWMRAARELTNDFRSVRKFYPYDKYAGFLGYKERELRAQADLATEEGELSAIADRLSQRTFLMFGVMKPSANSSVDLGPDVADKTRTTHIEMPSDHRGITFGAWLDIFLEFALSLAQHGKMKDSYEICEAAKDCALYYSNREDLFLIHICWITCALLLCDEETCVNVARFFMKDYQFTTDSYRMFAAVTRMVHSPVNWYSSGPSQKYILRQIKAMDFVFADEVSQEIHFTEKGSYSAIDENGQLIINEDLNVALLMLYGHILYTGGSYFLALNYFLRAYALDPENPMINLNIGLAYVHQALKRQAENRQHLILQGTTFLFNYYNSREKSPRMEERQEAHYNMARVYHMLGLTDLAIPYYDLVFGEIGEMSGTRDDILIEAAYNLQSLYSMSGNHVLASAVTRKWLVA